MGHTISINGEESFISYQSIEAKAVIGASYLGGNPTYESLIYHQLKESNHAVIIDHDEGIVLVITPND